MGIYIQCDPDGHVEVVIGHDLTDEIDEEIREGYLNLLNGLNLMLKYHPEFLGQFGGMARSLSGSEDGENEIEFTPDQELVDAIQKGKILPFNKKKMN